MFNLRKKFLGLTGEAATASKTNRLQLGLLQLEDLLCADLLRVMSRCSSGSGGKRELCRRM